MATLQELALDARLESRVRAADRRRNAELAAVPNQKAFGFPEVEGLVSPGAYRRDAIYRRSLIVADVLAAALAGTFSVVGVAGASVHPSMLLALPVVVLLGKLLGLYDRDELVFHKSTLDEAPHIFQLAGLYTLLAWLLSDFLIDGEFTRSAGLGLWLAAFLLTGSFRYTAREMARAVAPAERCMIIGRSGTRMRLAGKLAAARPSTEVVGYLPLEDERRIRSGWKGADRRQRKLGLDDLPELVRQLDVHRVIIIPGEADGDTLVDAVARAKASGVKVSILPRMFEVVGSSVEFDDIDGVTVLGVRRFGLGRSSERVKRMMDLVGAGLGLVVLAPLLALVAVAIKLDSRGPVFYRQWRVGRDGRPFRMVKYRSMVQDADALKSGLAALNVAGDGLFKVVDDPRITRVGRLIRKLSIDELPQLFNVLHGEMSLVGPRPLVRSEDDRVDGRFRRRLRLVPGMTGPWQILGPTRVPLTEMVGIDYLYGANWSLWLDIKILLRTLGHVLRRQGL
ncbi:MAG TPA: exopolysaccharide biosynthesis polyprenyl glycosylphosphotransferase [Thermoleophilaceae bacterium]